MAGNWFRKWDMLEQLAEEELGNALKFTRTQDDEDTRSLDLVGAWTSVNSEQYTHKYSTHRVAQHDHISSRERLRIFVSLKQLSSTWSCLVLCRTWHWPPAQILSHPCHPLLLPFRRSHLCTQALWPLRYSTAEWRIWTQISSLTVYEPKSVEIKAIDTEDVPTWRPRA